MPTLPDGVWSGFYEYDNGTQHGTQVELRFDGQAIAGSGKEGLGEFQVAGDSKEGLLRWTKTYTRAKLELPSIPGMPELPVIDLSGTQVEYRGEWDGQRIRGTWVQGKHSGAFELRPGAGHQPPPEAAQPKLRGNLICSKNDQEMSFPLMGNGDLYVGHQPLDPEIEAMIAKDHPVPLDPVSVSQSPLQEVWALFFFEGDELCVEAKGRTVEVNGTDIGKERRRLKPTDSIVCGPMTFRFEPAQAVRP